MRGYKIVARILLMLSVIDFALAAPALVREHKVRAIESNVGPGPSNPAPPIDGPRLSPGPGPTAARTDEPHPLNPTSPLAHGSQASNPPQIAASPESPQIVSSSSSDESYSSGPTDTHSSSMSSGSWASQAHVRPPPPNLPWAWSQPTRLAPNLPWRWSSRTRTHVPPPQSPEDDLSTKGSHAISWEQRLATGQSDLSSLDQLATGEPHPQTLSTVDGPSRIPGPTDNHPQPGSPSNPGPSTEPNPPPSAEPLHPGAHESWSLLSMIPKGKFKRHFSGYGLLNAE